MSDYFERNSRKLYLVGCLNKTIGKEVFIEKMANLPVVSNILRVETFYRDSGMQQSVEHRNMEDINFVGKKPVKLMVLFPLGQVTFLFRFEQGLMQDKNEEGSRIERKNNIVTVTMKGLNEETLFCEVKGRMEAALRLVREELPEDWVRSLTSSRFKAISEKRSSMVWKEVTDEFSRLSSLTERE